MNAVALHRFTIEGRLRGALERNEFTLDYQPQFDVRSGGISGMEALLRWTSDELGGVPPTEFIPIAEETGLILSDRRMGAAQRVPPGQGMAGRGLARWSDGGQRIRPAICAR
jgi:predicted signal transduction protein with EAL and GGDEF domain